MQIRDNEVLGKFPRAVRRRVLRALHLEQLQGSYLLASPRIRKKPNFLLTMLDLGSVDMYVPGVAVVEANARVNDFLILLDGEMRVCPLPWCSLPCAQDVGASDGCRRGRHEGVPLW